jgi:hypothetical protein
MPMGVVVGSQKSQQLGKYSPAKQPPSALHPAGFTYLLIPWKLAQLNTRLRRRFINENVGKS